jgi:signal peptidase I
MIFIRTFLLVVNVQYHSMSPTLEHGDRVLALRNPPKSWLRKGQVVLIWPVPGIRIPVPPGYTEPPYIKRIVAVSGETYSLLPDEKIVQYLDQRITMGRETFDFTSEKSTLPLLSPACPGTWDIPAKHVFVRGDNRQAGVDSTIWGPVPFRNILAVVLMKLPGKAEPAHVPPCETVRT